MQIFKKRNKYKEQNMWSQDLEDAIPWATFWKLHFFLQGHFNECGYQCLFVLEKTAVYLFKTVHNLKLKISKTLTDFWKFHKIVTNVPNLNQLLKTSQDC